jgi:hypothetical protein
MKMEEINDQVHHNTQKHRNILDHSHPGNVYISMSSDEESGYRFFKVLLSIKDYGELCKLSLILHQSNAGFFLALFIIFANRR